MTRRLFYALTGIATAYDVILRSMGTICGKAYFETSLMGRFSLAGSALLLASSLLPSGRWPRILAAGGCLFQCIRYIPGTFFYVLAVSQGTDYFDLALFIPPVLVAFSCVLTVKDFRCSDPSEDERQGAGLWNALSFLSILGVATPLLLKVLWNSQNESAEIAVFGPPAQYTSGTVREVTSSFQREDLKALSDRFNSPLFRERLARYNCGDPVPALSFQVSLERRQGTRDRLLTAKTFPAISAGGRARCLDAGIGYLISKEVAGADRGRRDPSASERFKNDTIREPHCACEERDGKGEWVTYPGPDEKL